MKKLLLLAFLLPGLVTFAQTSETNGNCKAQFKYEVNTLSMSPLPTFNFYDASEGNVRYWYWNFGDGTTSEEQNPVHSFALNSDSVIAIRTVSLTILTTDSCKSYYSENIQIINDTVWQPDTDCHAEFKY